MKGGEKEKATKFDDHLYCRIIFIIINLNLSPSSSSSLLLPRLSISISLSLFILLLYCCTFVPHSLPVSLLLLSFLAAEAWGTKIRKLWGTARICLKIVENGIELLSYKCEGFRMATYIHALSRAAVRI